MVVGCCCCCSFFDFIFSRSSSPPLLLVLISLSERIELVTKRQLRRLGMTQMRPLTAALLHLLKMAAIVVSARGSTALAPGTFRAAILQGGRQGGEVHLAANVGGGLVLAAGQRAPLLFRGRGRCASAAGTTHVRWHIGATHHIGDLGIHFLMMMVHPFLKFIRIKPVSDISTVPYCRRIICRNRHFMAALTPEPEFLNVSWGRKTGVDVYPCFSPCP